MCCTKFKFIFALTVTCLFLMNQLLVAQPFSTTVSFDGGDNGGFTGNAFFEPTGGNPDGNAHFNLETFGMELRTGATGEPANEAFLGDYSTAELVTIGVDVRVDDLNFFGQQVPRNLGMVFVDDDIQGPNGPSGLWFELGEISSMATSEWTRFELTIEDFSLTDLPPGWIGFGDEDPVTFEPILPDGATFASVLASVDQFQISTFEPGFFFGFTNFDVRIDNLSIAVTAIPEPAAGVVLMMCSVMVCRRRTRIGC